MKICLPTAVDHDRTPVPVGLVKRSLAGIPRILEMFPSTGSAEEKPGLELTRFEQFPYLVSGRLVCCAVIYTLNDSESTSKAG